MARYKHGIDCGIPSDRGMYVAWLDPERPTLVCNRERKLLIWAEQWLDPDTMDPYPQRIHGWLGPLPDMPHKTGF